MKPSGKLRTSRLASELASGLEEAIAFERGTVAARVTRARAQVAPVTTPGPAAIARFRRELGFAQPLFADVLNVSVDTVRSWEQGRRAPDGAALRLLQLAMAKPQLLADLVRVARVSDRVERRKRRAG